MRFLLFSRKKLLEQGVYGLLLISGILIFCTIHWRNTAAVRIVMGGRLYMESEIVEVKTNQFDRAYDEKYFRPSKLPILNSRDTKSNFLWKYYDKEPCKIVVPQNLRKTPEDTLVNYFSILKHAENLKTGQMGGCGTVGDAKLPYPVAYGFMTPEYQKRVPFAKYLQSFEGIGHINLIKLNAIPKDKEKPEYQRFFIELETIEGSSKGVTYFAYYYGYVYIAGDGKGYKIADIQLWGEDFLCAPYHGWAHDAETSVDIRYGEWCKLIAERNPTRTAGYVKDLSFIGTDGKEYLIKFFQLTNGTDIEIAQYRKNSRGLWELISLEPEKCLKNKQ